MKQRPVEAVVTLSMADMPAERRAAVLVDFPPKPLARLLMERFPANDGYVYGKDTLTPIKEWPQLYTHRVWVRRGLFWGYRVTLTPADYQRSSVRVTAAAILHLTEILALCAMIPALLLMAGMLIHVVPIWGTFKDYRDPILLVMGIPLGTGAALFGILWLLSRPIVAAKPKARIVEETANFASAPRRLVKRDKDTFSTGEQLTQDRAVAATA